MDRPATSHINRAIIFFFIFNHTLAFVIILYSLMQCQGADCASYYLIDESQIARSVIYIYIIYPQRAVVHLPLLLRQHYSLITHIELIN